MVQVPITHVHISPIFALHETSRSAALPSNQARATTHVPSSLRTAQPTPEPSPNHSSHELTPIVSTHTSLPVLNQLSPALAPSVVTHTSLPAPCTTQSVPEPVPNQHPSESTLNIVIHTSHPMVTRSKNNTHKPLTKLSLTSMLSSPV